MLDVGAMHILPKAQGRLCRKLRLSKALPHVPMYALMNPPRKLCGTFRLCTGPRRQCGSAAQGAAELLGLRWGVCSVLQAHATVTSLRGHGWPRTAPQKTPRPRSHEARPSRSLPPGAQTASTALHGLEDWVKYCRSNWGVLRG